MWRRRKRKRMEKIMPSGKIYWDLDTAECAVNIKMGKNEVWGREMNFARSHLRRNKLKNRGECGKEGGFSITWWFRCLLRLSSIPLMAFSSPVCIHKNTFQMEKREEKKNSRSWGLKDFFTMTRSGEDRGNKRSIKKAKGPKIEEKQGETSSSVTFGVRSDGFKCFLF